MILEFISKFATFMAVWLLIFMPGYYLIIRQEHKNMLSRREKLFLTLAKYHAGEITEEESDKIVRELYGKD